MTLETLFIATALLCAASSTVPPATDPLNASEAIAEPAALPASATSATSTAVLPPPTEIPTMTPIPPPTATPTIAPITEEDIKPFSTAPINVTPPKDFEAFWKKGLDELKRVPAHFTWTVNAARSSDRLTVENLTFDSLGGQKIEGVFVYPAKARKLPGILYLHGYAGNQAPLAGHALQGMAALSIGWRGSPALEEGFITRDLNNPEKYVLRSAILASCRGIEALCSRKEVDPKRIGITSDSIGGGLAIAVAALMPDKVNYVYAASGGAAYRFQEDGAPSDSKGEMQDILKFIEQHPDQDLAVKSTLRYFDVVSFGPWVKADVLLHVSLEDTIATPKQAFAVYNSLHCPRKILVFRNGGIGIGPIPRLREEVETWLKEKNKPKPTTKTSSARTESYIHDKE